MARIVHAPDPRPEMFSAGQAFTTLCLPWGNCLGRDERTIFYTSTVPSKVTCKKCLAKIAKERA